MKCGTCGNYIKKEDVYCSGCGSKIEWNVNNKKRNIGICILIGFIVSVVVFYAPFIVKYTLSKSGIDIYNQFGSTLLDFIQYMGPMLTIWLVPLLLYTIDNEKDK